MKRISYSDAVKGVRVPLPQAQLTVVGDLDEAATTVEEPTLEEEPLPSSQTAKTSISTPCPSSPIFSACLPLLGSGEPPLGGEPSLSSPAAKTSTSRPSSPLYWPPLPQVQPMLVGDIDEPATTAAWPPLEVKHLLSSPTAKISAPCSSTPISSAPLPLLGGGAAAAALPPLSHQPHRSWAAIVRGRDDAPKTICTTKPHAKILTTKISAHEVQKDHVPREAREDVPKAEGSEINDTDSAEAALPVTPQDISLHCLETDDPHARISQTSTDGRESPPAPVTALGPSTRLWYQQPDGHDLHIRCIRQSPAHGESSWRDWRVHSWILADMSEWMEKHIPPENDDGSVVVWTLSSWDDRVLGAVLQYMYLETFEGGVYDPTNPLNTEAAVNNVVHFIAGTSCLCRPMMDQAVDQIDNMTAHIKKLEPHLRHAIDLDTFESHLRQALYLLYDQPDQWRIRALRIVMGKLMAVCFPLILQSHAWRTKYQQKWATRYVQETFIHLHMRVVLDHKWLSSSNLVPRNDLIMKGYETIECDWVRYRAEGWKPADDMIFPPDEDEDEPDQQACFSPPMPANGKKPGSKAIPIVNPGSSVSFALGKPALDSGKERKHCSTGVGEGNGAKGKAPVTSQTSTQVTTATGDESAAFCHPTPNVEDRSASVTTDLGAQTTPYTVGAPVRSTLNIDATPFVQASLPGSPERAQQAYRFAPELCRFTELVMCHNLPLLPDGPFFFAESSTGVPANRYAHDITCPDATSFPSLSFAKDSKVHSNVLSNNGGSTVARPQAPFVWGLPFASVSATPCCFDDSRTASAAGSSVDFFDSPSCLKIELHMTSFDGADDLAADNHATPRPASAALREAHENADHWVTLRSSACPNGGEGTPRRSASKKGQKLAPAMHTTKGLAVAPKPAKKKQFPKPAKKKQSKNLQGTPPA